MFKTITRNDLPNVKLISVGEIPLHHLFPIETVCEDSVPSYIHYNGNLFRFFKTDHLDYSLLTIAVQSLPAETSFQIYRYHTPDSDEYFVSVSKSVDYSESIPTSIFYNHLANPLEKQLNTISESVSASYSEISAFASKLQLTEMNYLQSDLPYLMFDFSFSDGALEALPARTNMSFIKIGSQRVGTILSINSISTLSAAKSILSDQTYLQRIVTVIPSDNRQEKLESFILDDISLRDYVSQNEQTRKGNGRILYTDITFFLTSPTIATLKDKFELFYSIMNDHNISLYCHSNTTRIAYISMFPGNENCADRYSLIYEDMVGDITQNALEL